MPIAATAATNPPVPAVIAVLNRLAISVLSGIVPGDVDRAKGPLPLFALRAHPSTLSGVRPYNWLPACDVVGGRIWPAGQ
jgi:hypothetical protein